MLQICDGLNYAHQRGVVHRDIKPANILLLRSGQVRILDFGIAQLAAATHGELTRTGMIMGTLRYMAPEQVRGRADHRSDIFSVGAVSYELFSGRPPFTGDDPLQIRVGAAPLRGQNPAVSDGHQHAELLDQLQRIEQQVRGAVPAGVGQLVQELPPGALRQPLQGQRRTQQVPAQVFRRRGRRGDRWPEYALHGARCPHPRRRPRVGPPPHHGSWDFSDGGR